MSSDAKIQFFRRQSPPISPSSSKSSRPQFRKTVNDGPAAQADSDDDVIEISDSPPPAKRARTDKAPAPIARAQAPTPAANTSSSYFGQAQARPPHSALTSKQASSDNGTPKRRGHTRPAQLDAYRLSKEADAGDEPGPSQPRERTAEQIKRAEAWDKRMAGGGLIRRRRSLALDDAAAAELRRITAGGEGEFETPGDTPDPETPLDGDAGNPLNVDADTGSERQKAAEGVGSKLAAKFAAKGLAAKGKKKKEPEPVGPSGQTYTPLEKQFMEIKGKHPDVLLLMEVGYKYKFHGEDAKTASRELGIAAFPQRNFYTASIPTHRLHIHVKKLISLGYKVGVISQTETAALKKAGDNRNAPFTRELTHLFTAATYVEDASLGSSSTTRDDPAVPGTAPPSTNALVAIVERGMGGMAYDERVRIAMVSVVPITGDVVWDEFDDGQVRTELETRLTHIQPAELLLPKEGLSKATEKVLSYFAGNTRTATSSNIRVERIDDIPKFSQAFDLLTKFYAAPDTASGVANGTSHRKAGKGGGGGEIDLTLSDDGEMDIDETVVEPAGNDGAGSDSDKGDGSDGKEVDPVGLAAGLPSEEAVLALVDFPKQVAVALSVAVTYMTGFKLQDAFRHRSSFTRFVNRAHMLLSSNTLINLEIYRNQTDGGIYGSLLWLLDHTKTRMGRRLLREWIGRPLLDILALQSRSDAIEEIVENGTYHVEKMRGLLVNMPDLIRGLTRVQYGKANPAELATILIGLARVGAEFRPTEGNVFRSSLLNNILKTLPTIADDAKAFLADYNVKMAREGDIGSLWNDVDKFPELQDAKDCMAICEAELDAQLREMRKITRRPALPFVTVAGIEYLVEIPVKEAKSTPPKWIKVQSTKHVVRFHTPEVLRVMQEREQHKETLNISAKKAFHSFQADIAACHSLIVVARQLAVIDCLFSLATVAQSSGYVKPKFVADPNLCISQGRHPMVEMLRDEPYVPFDVEFSEARGKAKVITGPNMAGKSSCVRATALIVCLAQIGSFVPAESVTLGIHDAVQTRMGASDEIARGKSTFMVELSETSDILRTLTPRTLVILDELGRGTSTYDGVAIAFATLSHVAQAGCNTLFVTHYPTVAEQLAREMPSKVSNWHMAFDERTLPDGSREITFLYRLTRGLAEASFGVWCARLAGLPENVLQNAQLRAGMLKVETQNRAKLAVAKRTRKLLEYAGYAPGGADGTSGKVRPGEVLKLVGMLERSLR